MATQDGNCDEKSKRDGKGKKGLDSGEAMATRDGVGRAPGAAAAL